MPTAESEKCKCSNWLCVLINLCRSKSTLQYPEAEPASGRSCLKAFLTPSVSVPILTRTRDTELQSQTVRDHYLLTIQSDNSMYLGQLQHPKDMWSPFVTVPANGQTVLKKILLILAGCIPEDQETAKFKLFGWKRIKTAPS